MQKAAAERRRQAVRFRKLRIGWSVGCGIACVLLIALWARSYPHDDMLRRPYLGCNGYSIQSSTGRCMRRAGSAMRSSTAAMGMLLTGNCH